MADATAALEERLSALHENVTGIRDTLDRVAEAITKLAVLEERGVTVARDVKWAHERIDSLAERLRLQEENLIRITTSLSNAGKGMRILWAVFGGGITALAAVVIKWWAVQ